MLFGSSGDDALADALSILLKPVDADNLDNRRGAIDIVTRALAPMTTCAIGGWPRRLRSAPRGDDRRRAVQILAHKCHEALKRSAPAASRGRRRVEHVRRSGGNLENRSKKSSALAGPPVSDSLIAVAPPSCRGASAAPPALPAALRSGPCGWPGLRRRRQGRVVARCTYCGVAAVQAALEGTVKFMLLLGRVVRERTVMSSSCFQTSSFPNAASAVVVLVQKPGMVPRTALRAIQTPDRPRDPATGARPRSRTRRRGTRGSDLPPPAPGARFAGRNNTLGRAEEPRRVVGAQGFGDVLRVQPGALVGEDLVRHLPELSRRRHRKLRTSRSPDDVRPTGSCVN